MTPQARWRVRERANERGEYCQLSALLVLWFEFHVEHIRARQHGGDDDESNLCFSCPPCNWKKGTNQSAYDPLTNSLVKLYNPRLDRWHEHFRMISGFIEGLTAEGRATVELLDMNNAKAVETREIFQEDEDGSF